MASPLCTLLKKEVELKLEKTQLEAIENLKLLAATTPCLEIFNLILQIRLKIDASSEGLGALLEQNHGMLTYLKRYPVGYASLSLRNFKKPYVQIKKEILSIVFGVEGFHEYLYGCKLTVIDDDQPLKSMIIFSKSIVSYPPRIQTFLCIYKNMNLI